MHETTISGVPTYWLDGPAPLTGALVFRAGPVFETWRTAQVTHLVEHLAMSTLPKSHLDRNATVEPSLTVFHATGAAEEVVDFVNRIGRALSDLPTDRIELEAKVLRAEDGSSGSPALAHAVDLRYEYRGVGVLGAEGPGPHRLSADQVRAHAARYFTRDNAVLVFTGPPPEGIDLSLPAGEPVAEPAAVALPVPTPGYLPEASPVPALSFVLAGRSEARGMLSRIFTERVEDRVRHAEGRVYEVVLDQVRLRRGESLVAVFTDGDEEHAEDVVRAMWEALGDLADSGPTPAEMDHDLDGLRRHLDDPRSVADQLVDAAGRRLAGAAPCSPQERLAEAGSVTAEELRGLAAGARATTLVTMPLTPRKALDGLVEVGEWEPPQFTLPSGEGFGRKLLSLAPLDALITVSDEGISARLKGVSHGGRWEDVVGVAAARGLRLLVFARGAELLLTHLSVKNADRLFAIVDEHTAGVRFEATEDEILGE